MAALFPSVARAQDIYIINHSSLPATAIADALPAFQAAVDEDFVPAWNTPATLHFDTFSPPRGSWKITLLDKTGLQGAAGYHSVTRNDVPFGIVGTDEGVNWQLVFTHELDEMLVDPHTDRTAFVWPGNTFYLMEVGDPVETAYYTKPSATGQPVQISDFATERFWDSSKRGGKYDFLGLLHSPLTLLPGGYMVYNSGGVWQNVFLHKGPMLLG